MNTGNNRNYDMEGRRRPVRGAAAAAAPWRRIHTCTTPSSSSSYTRRQQSPSNSGERAADESIHEPGRDSAFVGTCLDMCPAKERSQRERLRDLSVFERLDGNAGRTSPGLAGKKVANEVLGYQKPS